MKCFFCVPLVRQSLAMLLSMLAAMPLCAENLEGCSWTVPDSDWTLDRVLPEVDLAGTLESDVIPLLYREGVPISFIARSARDPEVHVRRSGPMTVRELLDEVMVETPGYRLEDVGGKLVIYPSGEGFDSLVDLGEVREAMRAAAWVTVIRRFDSASPHLRGLRTSFRGSYLSSGAFDRSSDNNPWNDSISFGGVRRAVEHLVSLIAGSPSAAFTIAADDEGRRRFDLRSADTVVNLLLEAPRRVAVGEEFRVYPRAILAGGTEVTLIGSGCGVAYQTSDDAIRIDEEGRAVASAEGTSGIFAFYEEKGVFAEIEVKDE